MRFTESDLSLLFRACETYQDRTGSEWMWDQYEVLKKKLNYYIEENYDENSK